MNAFETIELKQDGHVAHIKRHGAHVTSFQPEGCAPVLWMSDDAVFVNGKAIRGGIPICAPWFGDHPAQKDAPAHGTVRTQAWDLLDQSDHSAVFTINSLSWQFKYRVAVGPSLEVSLTAINLASKPRELEAALHTYLTIGDVHKVSITGLEGRTYIDKMQSNERMVQEGAIRFTQETDRVYLNTPDTVTVDDPALKRKLQIDKRGSQSTVIWNPWTDKANRMGDFTSDAWPQMVCVETACIADNAIIVDPESAHTLTASIRIES